MGKYTIGAQRQKPKPQGPHPIWRGIGCLIMIIIPVISIAASVILVNFGVDSGWSIPYQLLGTPVWPAILYKIDVLWLFLGPITEIQNFFAYAAVSLILMLLIGSIFSFGYAIIYRMVGPSRYGPTDAPPSGRKVKRYTR